MLKPLKEFICDTCGTVINDIKSGRVKWESFYNEKENKIISRNYRICHDKIKCQGVAKSIKYSDSPLSEFLGNMAIVQTTKMLDHGPYYDKEYKGLNLKA